MHVPARVAALTIAIVAAASCRFDPAYRDVAEPLGKVCTSGDWRCDDARVEECVGAPGAEAWQIVDDCAPKQLSCIVSLRACATCAPGDVQCVGQSVTVCDPSGAVRTVTQACDVDHGFACRQGACVNLCNDATQVHSNIGCEYWAADLDNAMISASLNAAAQQYAIVVSNAEPDVPAHVVVEQDDAPVGMPSQLRVMATAVIAPHNLEVFKLGPREVDGSPDGQFNTGTGTALTRHAFRVTSNMPIVAYQFNPLDNVNVFSNDASQLLPVSALNGAGRAYVVAGWPQTIANSNNPQTNFGIDLRAFLAILATRPDTHVHVKTKARVIPGATLANGLDVGGEADFLLQPFDVLNLETGDFNADFTGTLIDADQPIAVFPGSEASDAPYFDKLADRYCCADHLEHQAVPVRAVGKKYAIGRMPNRTRAVIAAGANIGAVNEPEYYRVVATSTGATHVTTTLPAPFDAFDLDAEGASLTLTANQDFLMTGSQAIAVLDVQGSQDRGGVPRGLPGGDPSTAMVAPIEQWRNDYVLLTPDKYVFDYLVITAPGSAHVFIDGLPIDGNVCESTPADGLTDMERGSKNAPYVVYRCQLSYPIIDPHVPAPNNVKPGKQNDGVHHVQADLAVGVIAHGFDSYVSYAYTGGTQLREINPR